MVEDSACRRRCIYDVQDRTGSIGYRRKSVVAVGWSKLLGIPSPIGGGRNQHKSLMFYSQKSMPKHTQVLWCNFMDNPNAA